MTKTKKNSKTKKNRSCVNTLKDIIYTGGTNTFRLIRALKNAVSEIEQLRKERDEARRLYCEEAFAHRFNERRFNERGGLGPITDPKQIAQGMKWDCFKENTND